MCCEFPMLKAGPESKIFEACLLHRYFFGHIIREAEPTKNVFYSRVKHYEGR